MLWKSLNQCNHGLPFLPITPIMHFWFWLHPSIDPTVRGWENKTVEVWPVVLTKYTNLIIFQLPITFSYHFLLCLNPYDTLPENLLRKCGRKSYYHLHLMQCQQSHCQYKSHRSVSTKCVFYNEEFMCTLRLAAFFSFPIFSFCNELSIIPSYCRLIKWRRLDWNPITSTAARISRFISLGRH